MSPVYMHPHKMLHSFSVMTTAIKLHECHWTKQTAFSCVRVWKQHLSLSKLKINTEGVAVMYVWLYNMSEQSMFSTEELLYKATVSLNNSDISTLCSNEEKWCPLTPIILKVSLYSPNMSVSEWKKKWNPLKNDTHSRTHVLPSAEPDSGQVAQFQILLYPWPNFRMPCWSSLQCLQWIYLQALASSQALPVVAEYWCLKHRAVVEVAGLEVLHLSLQQFWAKMIWN